MVDFKLLRKKRMEKKEDVLKLESMLKEHDWFYAMSDDPKASLKGRESWRGILSLANRVEGGMQIVNRARPKI